MNQIKIACPCLFGLESLVAEEIRRLGYEQTVSTNGRVVFEGDTLAIARANLNLRCAERVLVLLAEFEARSFEELFQGVKRLPWEDWIGRDDVFPVKGWSLNSALHSVPDCQSIIKKAVVEKLKTVYHVDWFQETGAKIQIQFSILKNIVSVYLDTSGEGLHKRGYRQNANEAPLKETLAAAMVKLSHFYTDRPFYDPFCGSGTILIEAA
ncbi:MAG TPA: THUMP domain-containing protein, partial [Clostridia bacterium]|nr:THUMP domain-containing protein [Clostridia bacterium]